MLSHSPEQGQLLIALARQAIASEFDVVGPALPHPAWLDEAAAVFVTLTQPDAHGHNALRGCIGNLEVHRSLINDVQANARAAAFKDPRFPALKRNELDTTRIEVSILTPAEPMLVADEADALRQLRPGIDGVILEQGWHRATFLPQVWEQLPEPRQFIANLKHKAGLETDFWAPDIRLSRYQVEKFRED